MRVDWLEFEVLAGLEHFARREIHALFRTRIDVGEGRLRLRPREPVSLNVINSPRSVVAAYLVEHFDIARPRALLGHAYLKRMQSACERVLVAWPRGAFRSLHLSAAGADSVVMNRIKRELGERLVLEVDESSGDLFLRIRPASGGWQVLVRTSPRPLSTRQWRVCNLPGALNATLAHAMVSMTDPIESDVFVNVACGSGTLLVERLALGLARAAFGYDLDADALNCARTNLEASGYAASVELAQRDARDLPLETASVRTLVADLPYAMLLGTGEANASLYPELLAEAARVLMPDGRAVVVTTQNRLMRGVLEGFSEAWECQAVLPVKVAHRGGYITPSIYSLVRRHPV